MSGRKIDIGLLVLLLITTAIYFWQFQSVATDRLIFLSVGQGDSTLIETGSGQRVLIDGGPDGKADLKLSKLLPFWDHRLDKVVLTHSHADHSRGLEEILQKYTVDTLYLPDEAVQSSESRELMRIAAARQVPMVILDRDFEIRFSSSSYLTLEPDTKTNDVNESSIVVFWHHGSSTAVLMADTGGKRERDLVKKNPEHEELIKIGHHGSDLGTTDELLSAWQPQIAVISVGLNNKFKHPSGRVLKRLERYHVETLRTDRQGDLIFQFLNNHWQLEKS